MTPNSETLVLSGNNIGVERGLKRMIKDELVVTGKKQSPVPTRIRCYKSWIFCNENVGRGVY